MNDGLFDLSQPQAVPASETRPAPIQERQIEQIRKLFGAAGIDAQKDRKAFVESIAEARVASLRSLSRFQAIRIIEALSKGKDGSTGRKGSSWDEREEDTWIDKL